MSVEWRVGWGKECFWRMLWEVVLGMEVSLLFGRPRIQPRNLPQIPPQTPFPHHRSIENQWKQAAVDTILDMHSVLEELIQVKGCILEDFPLRRSECRNLWIVQRLRSHDTLSHGRATYFNSSVNFTSNHSHKPKPSHTEVRSSQL